MLSLRIPILALALTTFTLAQNTAVEVKAIEAHFTQSRIVPEMLDSFEPTALLNVNYAGIGDIKPGQKFAKEQVNAQPALTVTGSESLTGNFTLIMADANYVGSTDPAVTRHWLVNGVTIVDNKVTIGENSVVITKYAGPWPAAGSGSHRYAFLIYEQPETFVPLAEFTPDMPVGTFGIKNYIADTKLGPLLAGNYINVEEGTASGSVASTAPVVTSTLAVSSGASGSGSSAGPKPTGSQSGSANPTGSAAPGNGAITQRASALLAISGTVGAFFLF